MGNTQGMQHSRKHQPETSSGSATPCAASGASGKSMNKMATGLSLSAGPSPAHHPFGQLFKPPVLLTPKLIHRSQNENVVPVAVSMEPSSNNNFLTVPSSRRQRRNSDAVEYLSRSPSPVRQNARPIYLTTTTTVQPPSSPRSVDRTVSLDANVITSKLKHITSPNGSVTPKSPKINMKMFQGVDIFGRKSRKPSGDSELSIKVPPVQDASPVIPPYEIFEPLGSDLQEPEGEGEFRTRATTIANGHVARLKRLKESKHQGNVAKKKGLTHNQMLPTVFRFVANAKSVKDAVSKGNKTTGSNADKHVNTLGAEPVQVYIAGTMTNWKAVEMARPKGDSDFCAILDCPPGDIFFKFCVNGNWKIDQTQEKVSGRQNIMANVLKVKKTDFVVMEALACDSFVVKSKKQTDINEQSDWGQIRPIMPSINKGNKLEPQSGGPPILPPQLLQTQLNKSILENSDPVLLPEPTSHVMLNHLYAQSVKDNVLVMASTSRFKKKYCTVVFYKPLD